MAFRIYTLAKELKLDSKVLVDICAKAGIAGKGSALASLTEEEVVQLKAFLAKGNAASARPAATVAVSAPTVKATATPSLASATAAAAAAAAAAALAKQAAAPPISKAPAASSTAVVESPPSRREEPQEEYVAPPKVASRPPVVSRPPVLSQKPERPPMVRPPLEPIPEPPAPTPRRTDRPPRGTTIRLAAVPQAVQPAPPPPVAEPAPQKPDIKLPMDAIRATRAAAANAASAAAPQSARPQDNRGKRPDAPGGGAPGKPRPGGSSAPGGAGRGGNVLRPLLDSLEAREKERKKEKDRVGEARPPARKGAAAKTGGTGELGLGGREARQLNRRRGGGEGGDAPKRISLGDDEGRTRFRMKPKKKQSQSATMPRKSHVVVQMPATVRSFSEAVGVRAPQVLAKLMTLGKMVNINAELDLDTVQLLAADFNVEIELKQAVDLEAQMLSDLENQTDAPEQLVHRAPIVTVLGHVDHGKTSLLDRIIGINVVAGESGGITQHIRAYRIEKDGRPIAFVDTPGHEAFTEMRARGANVTDIAVLVVAGDDGVMPQTEEAISHAKAANVPIVVALNKADLPGIDRNRILQQLATAGLLATEWGGDTEVVSTSALKGTGIDELLETILTIAELHEYKANPARPGYGTCLEAEMHEGRGVVVKMMILNGTLKVGDIVVCGSAQGRVKAIYDTLQPRVTYQEAGPSTPVNIIGLDTPPAAGEHFYVLDDIARARTIAEKRSAESRQRSLGGGPGHVTLETLHERLGNKESQSLNVILRADTRGSIEAILKEFEKLQHEEVRVKVLQALVGGVSEADVHLADASDAIIIGFNVVPDQKSRMLAESKGVQVRRYDIIYQVTDDLRKALEGMLTPEKRDVELGRALVQRTFTISRIGTIAGCRVLNGTIERNSRCRVVRDSRVVGDYAIDSLKREKDDAREVREGLECGIKLTNFNDLKEGDLLETYKVEEVARTL